MNTQQIALAAPQARAQNVLPHVLAVDDDPAIRELVADYLRENGFRATAVKDGSAMRAVLESALVDLIVLDVGLRGEDGMRLTLRLRAESTVPIIMLSGHSDEADRVMGLEIGADDYLTKPFSPRELLARIRTVLRRRQVALRPAQRAGLRAYRFEGWELNINRRRLTSSDGAAVPLTNGEFSLLAALLSTPQRILSRSQLLDLSRRHGDEVYDRAIDVQIARLRRKVESDPAHPRCIVTQRGAGYLLDVPVHAVY